MVTAVCMRSAEPALCRVCGLQDAAAGIASCSDCEAIRLHRFTDRTVLVVDGSWSPESPTIGGAGIVLVDGSPTGEVIGQRYCGFRCHGSQDAEYQAMLRAHLWSPSSLIYSDAMFVVKRLQGYRSTRDEIGRQVRYLRESLRGESYQIAHRLSVQGRLTAMNKTGAV